MNQDDRKNVYRAALDEAHVELNEILGRVEELRLRKDRVEKVMEALKPMMGGDEQAATPAPQAMSATSAPEQRTSAMSAGPMQEGENPPQYHFMKVADAMPVRLQPAPNAWAIQPQRPLRTAGGF